MFVRSHKLKLRSSIDRDLWTNRVALRESMKSNHVGKMDHVG